jgi:hypothetical protein
MTTTTFTTEGAVGLVDWLKQPAPRFSLAIGATCGCDISRLGRAVCAQLNRPELPAGGHCRAFDPEDIRQLAGDPFWRNSVLAAAARHDSTGDRHCDYETLIRGVAAIGGAVLSGQSALEATADLDNVFRVALSHCDRCRPESTLYLDPDGFSADGLAAVIAKRFLRWCEEQTTPRHPHRAAALATVFA